MDRHLPRLVILGRPADAGNDVQPVTGQVHVFGPKHLQLAGAHAGEGQHGDLDRTLRARVVEQEIYLVEDGSHLGNEDRLVDFAKAQGIIVNKSPADDTIS